MLLQQLRYHHLDMFAADAVNSAPVQLMLLPLMFFLFFQSSSCTTRTYHFDINDAGAIALQHLIPFFGSASGSLKNTNFTIFQEL